MNPVVEGEAQTLDLLVECQSQFVTGLMADGFAKIILQHGEETAQHTDHKQDEGGNPKRMFGARIGALTNHALCLVYGLAQ